MEKILNALKLSPQEIKAFKYLQEHEHSTSIDIQQAELLQQPEVSKALKILKEKKYIETKKSASSRRKRGRQVIVYTLATDVYKRILTELSSELKYLTNKADSFLQMLEELYAIVKANEKVQSTNQSNSMSPPHAINNIAPHQREENASAKPLET